MNDPSFFKDGSCSHEPDRRHQHGGHHSGRQATAARCFGLHLRRGLRDHPGGGRGPDARRASAASHDLYASVIARGRASEKSEVNISRNLGDRHRHPSHLPRLYVREDQRRVHGGPRLRRGRERELPCACHVDVLARDNNLWCLRWRHPRASHLGCWRGDQRSGLGQELSATRNR